MRSLFPDRDWIPIFSLNIRVPSIRVIASHPGPGRGLFKIVPQGLDHVRGGETIVQGKDVDTRHVMFQQLAGLVDSRGNPRHLLIR